MAGNVTSATGAEDFDFNKTCQFFKSSFARTLSLNNGSNCCRSLDFDIVYQQHDNNNNKNNNNNIENNHINKNGHSHINDIITNANGTKNDNGFNAGGLVKQKRTTYMDIDAKNEVIISNDVIGTTTTTLRNQNKIMKPTLSQTSVTNNNKNNNNNVNHIDHATVQQSNTPVATLQKQPQSLPLLLTQHQQQPQQQHHQMMPMHFKPNFNFMATVSAKDEVPANTTTTRAAAGRIDTKQMTSGTRRVDLTEAVELDVLLIDKAHAAGIQPISMVNNNKNTANNNKNTVKKTSLDMAESSSSTVNVETVLLRNQVDTLQWQLKQVETSCEMYHAVMEEVSRFLERYQTQKQQQRLNYNNIMEQQQQQMSRSKSLYQVYGGATACYENSHQPLSTDDTPHNAVTYLRARSSTNLIDLNAKPAPTLPAATIDHNSYSAFKDFTWRRSPKKTSGTHTGLDDVEEKLCQEAFRLSRTIQNLLDTSTKQPDLTQHRNSLSSLVSLGRLAKSAAVPSSTTNQNSCENVALTTAATNAAVNQPMCRNAGKMLPKANKNSLSAVADILFMRSNTMRDSRLSVRSSTDSSVHSTTSSTSSSASTSSSSCTSSKLETDDDTMVHGMNQQMPTPPTAVNGSGGSTTEDESGFSSINSFQDIGVPPFSSTLIERKPSLKVQMRPKSITLTKHPNNILGLPDTPTHVWESSAVTNKTSYHNANKFHRFSTLSTEEAGTVLWV